MKKWPLTVGFNVGEPPPHKNYWLNSIVIAISQLPLDLGEVGLGSKEFVPCCVHGWMLWAASSSAQVQHKSWTKQSQAQSLNLIRISLQRWGGQFGQAGFCFPRLVGLTPSIQVNFFIKMFFENIPCAPGKVCSSRKGFFLQRAGHASSCGKEAIASSTCENRSLFIKIMYLLLQSLCSGVFLKFSWIENAHFKTKPKTLTDVYALAKKKGADTARNSERTDSHIWTWERNLK